MGFSEILISFVPFELKNHKLHRVIMWIHLAWPIFPLYSSFAYKMFSFQLLSHNPHFEELKIESLLQINQCQLFTTFSVD